MCYIVTYDKYNNEHIVIHIINVNILIDNKEIIKALGLSDCFRFFVWLISSQQIKLIGEHNTSFNKAKY